MGLSSFLHFSSRTTNDHSPRPTLSQLAPPSSQLHHSLRRPSRLFKSSDASLQELVDVELSRLAHSTRHSTTRSLLSHNTSDHETSSIISNPVSKWNKRLRKQTKRICSKPRGRMAELKESLEPDSSPKIASVSERSSLSRVTSSRESPDARNMMFSLNRSLNRRPTHVSFDTSFQGSPFKITPSRPATPLLKITVPPSDLLSFYQEVACEIELASPRASKSPESRKSSIRGN